MRCRGGDLGTISAMRLHEVSSVPRPQMDDARRTLQTRFEMRLRHRPARDGTRVACDEFVARGAIVFDRSGDSRGWECGRDRSGVKIVRTTQGAELDRLAFRR